MKGVSIIICCYNSALRLPETLRHIAMQEVKREIAWEVIVVNNASTDDTSIVAANEWGGYSCNADFKVVDQPIPGLSAARKMGVEQATFEYILFCDDDNWLAPDYVQSAFGIMNTNPEIGVLGGQTEVVSEMQLPDWFEDVKGNYAVGKQNTKSGDITSRGYVWGAGFVLRKNLLMNFFELGLVSLLSGRKAKELSSGDDTEICQWFIMSGYKLYYDERLRLRHFIPEVRLTQDYFKKMLKGHETAQKVLNVYFIASKEEYKNHTILKKLYFFFRWILAVILFQNVKKDYFGVMIQSYLVDRFCFHKLAYQIYQYKTVLNNSRRLNPNLKKN
jgi:glycosyltransferase involved in cell wall biosynthesis